MYKTEYLNTIDRPRLPPHVLRLKLGQPVICIRHIGWSLGVTNGTRLLVTQLMRRYIECIILTGIRAGHTVLLPRITFDCTDTELPFTIVRRQFPLRPAFAVTINKSQVNDGCKLYFLVT